VNKITHIIIYNELDPFPDETLVQDVGHVEGNKQKINTMMSSSKLRTSVIEGIN